MIGVRMLGVVTIKLEGNFEFAGFDCHGGKKNLCDGCRLRFQCLSERDVIEISSAVVDEHKIIDLESVVRYMFSEGRIPYELEEYKRHSSTGEIETRLAMRKKT